MGRDPSADSLARPLRRGAVQRVEPFATGISCKQVDSPVALAWQLAATSHLALQEPDEPLRHPEHPLGAELGILKEQGQMILRHVIE